MKIYVKISLLLIGILLTNACETTKPASVKQSAESAVADLKFQNINVIDAQKGLQENMTVLVKDNRIVKVAKAADLAPTGAKQTIVGTDKYLIPGLWDAHVHLVFTPGLESSMFRLFLAHGITSIRDTGGQLKLVLPEREKARKDPQNAPRVMLAGPLLDGKPTVYDGSTPQNPHLGIGAGTVAEAEKNADEMIGAEVDLLKAYEMLTPEAFKAILEKGKTAGLPVTGHVPLSMDVVEASDAGMRSMEHMRNLEFACSADWEELLKQRRQMLFAGKVEIGSTLRRNIHKAQRSHAVANQDATRRTEVLKHLANNGTWQIPTFSIMTAFSERFITRTDWQQSFTFLPSEIRNAWTKNSIAFGRNTPVDEASKAYSKWMFEMVGHMQKAGVEIMAGTDCPIFYLTPGYSLHEELALLVKAGMTPLEAIGAATIKPAEYFNLEKELGLIQEGMYADLVVLNANPLENIRNTLEINAVIRDGKLHDRAALDVLLTPTN